MRNVFRNRHSLSNLSDLWNRLLPYWKLLQWSDYLYLLQCFVRNVFRLGHSLSNLSDLRD